MFAKLLRAFDPSFGRGKKMFGRQFSENTDKVVTSTNLWTWPSNYGQKVSFYTIPLEDDYLFKVMFFEKSYVLRII